MTRLIAAIALAVSLLGAGQAQAGGYYPGGYAGYYDDGYAPGYYGRGYYGYAEPSYAYRYYWGPVPIISPIVTTLFGPGPRCQHRVPVLNYQGELRAGWISGC
ncbi:MAG TPA: hypothetical protein VFB31_13835 [Pseudolabrys sp.]|nr:hypothetical protein [Pseudolabrys sp.]